MQVDVGSKEIKFGVPEIVLIALFATGYFAHRGGFKCQKVARWGSLLIGLIVLGFIYNAPLTIAHFNSLLLGFWPNWQDHIYWYLLLGGIFFVVAVDGKNPYCTWFCPFGAAQECLGAIGGAKLWTPGKYRYSFKLMQRFLAWSAIILGLVMRNPGISSYEIFGTLFSFNGVIAQWIILVIILLLSLFVRRPWCEFLCPIDTGGLTYSSDQAMGKKGAGESVAMKDRCNQGCFLRGYLFVNRLLHSAGALCPGHRMRLEGFMAGIGTGSQTHSCGVIGSSTPTTGIQYLPQEEDTIETPTN